MSIQATPRTVARAQGGRDQFLDMLRAWSILRVVAVHIMGLAPVTILWWPAPSFVLPGMPMLFFVSGALALRSLDPTGRRPASTRGFLSDRLRRILLPYWAYFAVVASITIVVDVLRDGDLTQVNYTRMALGPVPLINPITSPSGFLGMVHLWFLVVIIWLTLLAPALVRWHRRTPRLLLLVSVALLVAVPLLARSGHVIYPEIGALALFQFFYVLGFSYTDNGIVSGLPSHRARIRIAGWRALLVGVAFTGVAWVLWRWEHPISIQDSALVQAALGISAIGFMVWLREPLVALAGRIRPQLAWLTRRTLTIYLWGWPCTALAKMAVDKVGLTGWTSMGVFVSLTVLGLVAAVRVFGPIEDIAARRKTVDRDREAPPGRAHIPSKSRVLVSEH